jgi:hypothetical protein
MLEIYRFCVPCTVHMHSAPPPSRSKQCHQMILRLPWTGRMPVTCQATPVMLQSLALSAGPMELSWSCDFHHNPPAGILVGNVNFPCCACIFLTRRGLLPTADKLHVTNDGEVSYSTASAFRFFPKPVFPNPSFTYHWLHGLATVANGYDCASTALKFAFNPL